tara:strand:+ start:697 stop:1185 length:489 start_codon:yes stop_codon:yes gene_type:complete
MNYHDTLNNIYVNFTGLADDSFEQTEEYFAVLRGRLAEIDGAVEGLVAVLCDPEGRCCINGSEADRRIVDAALDKLKSTALTERQQHIKRIEELETRLEVSAEHEHDGIFCRDETIRLQDKRIEELEGALREIAGMRPDNDLYYSCECWIEAEKALSTNDKG